MNKEFETDPFFEQERIIMELMNCKTSDFANKNKVMHETTFHQRSLFYENSLSKEIEDSIVENVRTIIQKKTSKQILKSILDNESEGELKASIKIINSREAEASDIAVLLFHLNKRIIKLIETNENNCVEQALFIRNQIMSSIKNTLETEKEEKDINVNEQIEKIIELMREIFSLCGKKIGLSSVKSLIITIDNDFSSEKQIEFRIEEKKSNSKYSKLKKETIIEKLKTIKNERNGGSIPKGYIFNGENNKIINIFINNKSEEIQTETLLQIANEISIITSEGITQKKGTETKNNKKNPQACSSVFWGASALLDRFQKKYKITLREETSEYIFQIGFEISKQGKIDNVKIKKKLKRIQIDK